MDQDEDSGGNAGQNSEPGKKSKNEKKPTVGVFAMFRYSDGLDKMYMLLGTLAALINGSALPVMMLVLGNMTDMFADAGSNIPTDIPDWILTVAIMYTEQVHPELAGYHSTLELHLVKIYAFILLDITGIGILWICRMVWVS